MELEDAFLNLLLFFVLFCLAGAVYTRVSKKSPLLKNTVGI